MGVPVSHRTESLSPRSICTCTALIGALLIAGSAFASGSPAGVNGDEWASIQEQIEAERHTITKSNRPSRLYRADNSAQRFTAHFGSEDVVLVPHGRGEPAWQFGLRLTAWGAAHDLRQVEFATATAEDNRVEYRRGPLTEWYINTTMGLEQGFTIEAPPADDIAELILEMTLDGDLTARLSDGGNSVTFRRERTNTTLTYSGLAAWDAVGEPLEVRMALSAVGTELHLAVAVDGAVWPITVDSIFAQVAKLLPTPEVFFDNTWFGKCVAVDGDLMVVGLRDDENGFDAGAAYVFQRDQNGPDTWGQVARTTADDGSAQDSFGYSVSISGDTLIVGAPSGNGNDQSSGSAYVFRRDHGGTGAWGQVVKLIAADGEFFDEFGVSVSISGDTAIVGARRDDDQGADSGSTYVFRRDQGGSDAWGQVTKITAADGADSDYFGASVSISGDTAIVGARSDDDNGYDSGSAYVFRRDQGGPDAWGNVSKITPSDGEINDLFGYSVAISADTAIVGAHWDDDNGSSSGSTYVFQRHQGGTSAWGQVVKITPADGAAQDYFGASVSISGDTTIIGAYGDSDNGSSSGSTYIFQRHQGGPNAWGRVAKITPADGAAQDYFGTSVSISADTAVVGAPYDDDNGSESGSAYVFQRDQNGPNTWGQVTKQSCPGALTARRGRLGSSVSVSANTAIIGAPGYFGQAPDLESAYVFDRDFGGLGAWGLVAKVIPTDGVVSDLFGWSVSASTDTAVVGAPYDDDIHMNSGSTYVFRHDQGGPNAWGQVAKLIAADSTAEDTFGWSVTISGDTAIVGAPGDDDNGSDSGSAYVFVRDQGGFDAWGQVAKITPDGSATEDNFGVSVSIDGDTAVVGAFRDDDNGPESGSAYIFQRDQGGSGAWGQTTKLTAADGASNEHFGVSVAINGDSAIVGAYEDDDNGSQSGSAYVFRRNHGGPNTWGQVAKLTAADGAESDFFGRSVSISGDTAIVGASGDDDNGVASGSTYVFRRNQSGSDAWGQVAKITPADGAETNNFGSSVSVSADTAIAGAPGDDDIGGNSGSAYVFIIGDTLFVDDFETGDTSVWSAAVP